MDSCVIYFLSTYERNKYLELKWIEMVSFSVSYLVLHCTSHPNYVIFQEFENQARCPRQYFQIIIVLRVM
jgi:hypothetical protein